MTVFPGLILFTVTDQKVTKMTVEVRYQTKHSHPVIFFSVTGMNRPYEGMTMTTSLAAMTMSNHGYNILCIM